MNSGSSATRAAGQHEPEHIRRYQDFTTIDWIQDSIIERNRRIRTARQLRASHHGQEKRWSLGWLWLLLQRIGNAGQSWFVISLVGVCIGVNAALISIVTEWLSDIKMGYCYDAWWLNQQFCCWEIEGEDDSACDSWHPWSTATPARYIVYVLFAATFSFMAAHLVKKLAKYAAGSGISEIKCIIAGFTMKGFLGFSTLAIKSLSLPLVIASGLSVGKEGPSVHVACCVGFVVAGLFHRLVRSEGKMREIITASSAAGVAVAFGAPIGGVLFSIEEMASNFNVKTMWKSFFCALVATVTLSAMNPYRSGKLVLFQVTYDRDWHFFEILFFIILGVFGGLYGALMVKFNMQYAAFRRKYLTKYPVLEAVALATITGIIGYWNRFLRIDMTESMAILFRECDGGGDYGGLCQTPYQWTMAASLLVATVIRVLLVVVSYGSKVPCGIFVPSMAVGAYFGRMVGILVKALNNAYPQSGMFAVCKPDVPCITPGTYAFLGAAATLSGVMRITVTVVVIMFELTGALTYILPTMIVLLVTKFVGDALGVTGIADEAIRFNGYPFLEKDDHQYNVPVARVMRTDLHTLPVEGLTLRQLETTLGNTTVKGYPIVSIDSRRTLLGYVDSEELRYVLERARERARDVQDITSDTPCSFAAEPEDQHEVEFSGMGAAPGVGMDEAIAAEIIDVAVTPDVIKLWPWVNQTPLTVAPQLPLEIAMQLFKRMGPRVILVESHGTLAGLITVKDVLRFTLTEISEHQSHVTWSNDHFEAGSSDDNELRAPN
ncbi:glycerol ethanol, ferric requiring protein [Steccherinum ochraceum]|uniref:Chloride channel protein n=1 Tax=Steccherinum ochraceum TaxID=92696 RepID=A0A4R0RFV2_9APHY|nr:glycerol ethanol, ferric requiring protein [Steccherinum ochraceum]